MTDLNKLSPAALRAAMTGGTEAWGEYASVTEHACYVEPIDPRSRRRCSCGCKRRSTHRGMANGIAMADGCELSMRQWAKDPMGFCRRLMDRRHSLQPARKQ